MSDGADRAGVGVADGFAIDLVQIVEQDLRLARFRIVDLHLVGTIISKIGARNNGSTN